MTLSGSLPIMGLNKCRELMQTALGQSRADLAVINAGLVNVYTGELLSDSAVAVKGQWIASVGREAREAIGPETTVIDAGGMTLIPGLIDGHNHLATLFSTGEFLKRAMLGGTTTVVTETMEFYPVGGYDGIVDFLETLRDQPIKVFATVTAMVSISRACNGIPLETLKKLIGRDDVLGLGESYWQSLLQNPDDLLPLYEETLRNGKTIEGHSAGAGGKKLMAYAAAGVSSCHEPITAAEVLERLRLGLYVMVREGSIRREIEAVSGLAQSGQDLRRLILVTDGIDARDLIEKGYMDFVVQKAIDAGFDPIRSIQMATLNVAEHFSLDGLLGGIAPGRYADLLIIPDVKNITPKYVISGGRIVAQGGDLLCEPRKTNYSEASCRSVNLPEALKPEDFAIYVGADRPSVTVRIIDQITDLVTQELKMEMPVTNGEIRADTLQDIAKVAAVDRSHCPGKRFVGLLRGFRMRSGAFASSAAWDTSDIVVVGAQDADMALAVNRIRALQGGMVVCDGGRVIAEFPLPFYGLLSDMPMGEIARKMREIDDAAAGLGIPFANPSLTLVTLTCAAIPYLRICEEGLVNLRDGRTVELILE